MDYGDCAWTRTHFLMDDKCVDSTGFLVDLPFNSILADHYSIVNFSTQTSTYPYPGKKLQGVENFRVRGGLSGTEIWLLKTIIS